MRMVRTPSVVKEVKIEEEKTLMARETPPSWKMPLKVSIFFGKTSLLVFLSSHLRAATLGEDAHVLERLGCGSRLSNISAIMEMFGEQVLRDYASVFIYIIIYIC